VLLRRRSNIAPASEEFTNRVLTAAAIVPVRLDVKAGGGYQERLLYLLPI